MRGFQPAPTARLDLCSPVRPARRGPPASSQVSQMSTPLPSRTTESCQVVAGPMQLGHRTEGPCRSVPTGCASVLVYRKQSVVCLAVITLAHLVHRPAIASSPKSSCVPSHCVLDPSSTAAAIQLCSPATLTIYHPICVRPNPPCTIPYVRRNPPCTIPSVSDQTYRVPVLCCVPDTPCT